jgi:hypothetical protein
LQARLADHERGDQAQVRPENAEKHDASASESYVFVKPP